MIKEIKRFRNLFIDQQETICNICQESYSENDNTLICRECLNYFHYECCKKWDESQFNLIKDKCPVCKTNKKMIKTNVLKKNVRGILGHINSFIFVFLAY